MSIFLVGVVGFTGVVGYAGLLGCAAGVEFEDVG